MCKNDREWNPEPSDWRSETSKFLVTQSRTDRSARNTSPTDEIIPESTSAHFSSQHSIKKTVEPDGEGVKKVQSQTCAQTEEWTCTICTREIIRGGGWWLGGGQNKSSRQRQAVYSDAAI